MATAVEARLRRRVRALEKALRRAAATIAAEAMNYQDCAEDGTPIVQPHGHGLYDESDRANRVADGNPHPRRGR